VRLAQVAASVAVVVVLAREVKLDELARTWERTRLGWLVLAFGIKAVTLLLHEVRLWLAFPQPRPALRPVISIGFAAGLLNLVLPGRGGDLAAMAMLHRELEVPAGGAAAAVTIVAFMEAAVFGLILLVVLGTGAARWEQVMGEAVHHQALQYVTVITLGGIGVAVAIVIAGRLLARRGRDDAPGRHRGAGLLAFLREAITDTGSSLSSPGAMAAQVGVSIVQVVAMVGAFALALPAIGVHIPLPWLAASGVLAISSIAAVVLPPTYGAGPAAASVAVLPVFGLSQADALAFAVAWWLISQVPAVAIGLPCLWARGGSYRP